VGRLLATLSAAVGASVVYPVLRFVSPPHIPEATTRQVEAGLVNDPDFLDKGYKIVRFAADPVIVVRVEERTFRAFAATCTHLDCIVEYRKDRGLLWCNCHNGQFDLEGRNVGGPPPRPLETFRVDLIARGSGQPETVVVSKA